MFQITEKGIHSLTDNYIYHIQTTRSSKEIFIVTSLRVMYIIRSYWTGSYKVFFIIVTIYKYFVSKIIFVTRFNGNMNGQLWQSIQKFNQMEY